MAVSPILSAGTANSSTYPAASTSIGHNDGVSYHDNYSQSVLGDPGDAITVAMKKDLTNTIEIVDIYYDDMESRQSDNPGIWETEPKEDIGLDIYYEASQAYPIELNSLTNEMYAPYGSTI